MLAAFFRALAWFFLDPERLEGSSEILVEQVDIDVEREARGVVSEPALDLEDVAPFGEESRRDGVAEGVEAGPLDGGLLARRRQHPVREVVGVKRRPSRRGEHPVVPGAPSNVGPELSDFLPEEVEAAIEDLAAEGVLTVGDDETIRASLCARHLDALGLVSI